MIGDMRMRTMHSLSYALSKFDSKVYVIAPDEMYFLPEFETEVRDMGFNFTRKEHIEQVIGEADVVYMEPVVQPDYTKSREEVKSDKGRTPRELSGDQEAAVREGQERRHRAALAAAPGRTDARMSTTPASSATGSRPTTACWSACRCWR